jgi:hypothetical protein
MRGAARAPGEVEHRVPPGLQPAAAVDGKRGRGGMVFTLDALHTNRRAARLITQELHAH